MKNPNFIKSVSILAAILVYSHATHAQIVSCNAFLQGNYVEVGVNINGAFGTSVNAPTGYHPRGSGGPLLNTCLGTCTVSNELGFVADPNRTGWNPSLTGTGYFGDYFVPGTPEEGWSIESNGHESDAWNQNDECSPGEMFTGGMTGSILSYSAGATVSSTWQGMNSDGIQITQVTSLDTANVFFTVHITLKNTAAATINNVYYLRTVDPDNDETLTGGGFPTVNTIVYQLPNTLGATLVSATGVVYTNVWLGLGTLDCRARCFYIDGLLTPSVSLDSLYNELTTTVTYTGTNTNDEGIGLVFSFGNIAPGDSVTFAYAYVLKESDLTAALNSTVSAWTATGDTATSILSKDTAYVCENILDTVSLTDTGTTSWSWISLTGETLSTYTGTHTTVSVNTTPVRLLAIGLGSGCAGANDTVYMTIVPRVPAVTATSNSPVCAGSPINFTGAPAGTGTTYFWSGPAGYTSTAQSPTIASAVAGDAGTYRFSEVQDGCASDTATTAVTVGTVTPAAISPAGSTLCPGNHDTLRDATSSGVWTSSNTTVATVAGGVVTSIATGVDTITYAIGGCKATATVTVNTTMAAITPASSTICGTAHDTLTDATSGGVWTSSNTAVATVAGGIVWPEGAGADTITYSAGGCAATAVVTVNSVYSISPVTPVTCIGSTVALTDGTTGGTWGSGNTAVATISSSGAVTGAAIGTTTISYGYGGCYATEIVTVTAALAAITPASPATVCLGDTITLHDAATGGTWASSNTALGTISSSGIVYSVSGSGIIVSYTVGYCLATEDVTFSAGVAAISPLTSPICSGTTASLTDATTGGTWSSSATGTATVTSGGIVSGVAAGTATIDYTVGSCSATTVVTVSTAPGPIIPPGSVTLCAGSTAQLTDATTGGSWINGTTSIATVNPIGVVTGVSPGTTSVLYAIATCIVVESVTVTPGVAPIFPSSPTICIGSTLSLTDATTGGAWSSVATGVATVTSGGVVSGVAAGTAVIVYTAGSCSASTIVTVTAAPAITGNLTACTGSLDTLHDAISGVWSSGNIGVAAIGATTGILTGTAAGTASITDSTGPGCKVTAIVTINPTPVIAGFASPVTGLATNPICVGSGADGLITGSSGGTWASGNTAVATIVSGSGSATGVSGGTSTITYTVAGCSVTDVLTVVVSSAISPASPSVCEGGTATLTDVSTSGVWSSSNTSLATVSTSGVVSGLSSGTDTIDYVIYNGTTPLCTYTTTVNITTGAGSITPSTAVSFCSGTTTSLSDAISGGVWSSSNSGLAAVSTSGVVSGYSASTVTITYTVGSCNTTKTLTINQGPAAISPSLPTVCMSATMSLTDGVSGGVWASGNTAVATVSSSGVVSGVATGTATISYTIGSCTVTDIVNVAGVPSVITPTTSIVFCSASTTTLVESVTGGTWTSGSTTIATVTEGGVVTGVTAGTATISYNSGGCFITKTVTVSPGPAAILPASPTICTGNTQSLTDAVSGGSWSSSATGIATVGSTGIAGGVVAGTAVISYTIGSCIATNPVTVVTAPTVGPISGTTSLCVGTTITLTEAATIGAWSSTNTAAATVSTAGIVYGAGVGTATISYTVSTSCGVIGAAQLVTVNTTPSAGTITGSSSMCAGTTMSLSNTVLDGSWSSSNGTASINSATGLVTGIASGTDTITYTITTPCGTASTTKVISIGAYLTAGTITGAAILCGGATVHLTDLVTGGVWSSSNTSATIGSTGIVTGAPVGGMDTISYTVSAGCGTATSTFVMDVYPTAISGTMTGVSILCVGSSATFTETATGGAWGSHDANATVTGGGIVTGVSAGTDVISYTVTNSCGTTFATLNVTIGGAVTAGTLTGPGSVCAATPVTLTDAVSGGVWSSSNTNATISTVGLVTAITSGLDTISYTVTTACGTATATFVISANGTVPTAGTITGPSGVCVGYPMSLSDVVSGGVWTMTNSRASITSAGLVTGTTVGIDTTIYTVTTTCGVATTSQAVTVGTSAGAGSIAGTTVVCAGSTILLTDAVSGGIWSSSNTNATASSGIVTGVAAGTATISYSISYSCGTAYAIKNITINPSSGSSSIAGSGTVCLGTTTILTDGLSGGVWSSSNTNVTVSGGVVTGVALGTSTVAYSISSSCGTSTASTLITIVAGSAVTVGPISSLSIVCVGSGITLVDPTIGGVWAASNGNAIVVGAGIIDGVSPGIDTITYTVTGICGSAVAIKVLNVDTIPIVAPITGPTSQCVGATIALSDPDGGGVWTASTPAVGTVTLSTGVVEGISAGTTTITYTVTNLFGCPGIATITDAVTPATIATAITGSASVCAGATVTLSNATTGGTWASSNTAVAVIDPVTGTVTGVTPGTATITYLVVNSCGASFVTSEEIVNALPSVAPISGAATGCVGSSVTLSDATIDGIWSSSNTTIATVNSTTGAVTGIASSLVTIYYTVTNASGCSASASASIFINPAPAIDPIMGTASECVGSSTSLSDGAGSGAWSSSNTAIARVDASGNVTGITPGTVTISYIISGSGCPGIATVTDIVNTIPVASPITGVLHVCAGATTPLGNSIPGGAWISGNVGVAQVNATSGIVTGFSGGIAEIYYSVANICGSAMDSTSITVYPGPEVDPITAAYTALCTGDLLDVSDGITGGIWVTSSTAIATVSSAGIVTGVSTGIDSIYYVVTNSRGCSSSAMLSIAIGGAIVSAAVAPTGVVELCKGHTEYMHVVSSGGVTYQWLRNAGPIAGATDTSYITSAIGNYAVVVSNGICSETVPGPSVVLAPVPVITFTAPDILYTGSYAHYQWYRNGVLIAGATGSTLNENGGGIYTVVVTDANGCSDTSIGYTMSGTGVNTLNGQENIKVYPNPATTVIHIDAPEPVNVSILSIDGKVLIEQKDATDIDISPLADGMYLVMVYDQTGLLLQTDKFAKLN